MYNTIGDKMMKHKGLVNPSMPVNPYVLGSDGIPIVKVIYRQIHLNFEGLPSRDKPTA